MIRFLLPLLILLNPLAASARCQGEDITTLMPPEAVSALQADVAATLYGQGLYWKAERSGQTLHILGTMHLPDPRHDEIVARVQNHLAASSLVLVEATADDQIAMQTYMARNPDLITLPQGQSLPDLLGEATWETLRAAAEARGIPGFMAARMQPWFLALNLSMPPCAMAAMIAGEFGLDGLIMEEAAARNIPVAALEPWEEVFALLTQGTMEEHLDALRMAAISPALQDAMMASIIDAYFKEETAFVWHLTSHLQPLFPDIPKALYDAQIEQLTQQLLVDRNHDWIPVIETAAEQHDQIFIAFGAAHLIGEDGVLHLLSRNGWEISQQ